VALFGVGADSAGALLVAVGDNPDRLHSEAAFSMLCGASPIQASSGKTTRHLLGDQVAEERRLPALIQDGLLHLVPHSRWFEVGRRG
jgi:hypothetical protein